jgi:hypothetical protein
MNLHERSCQPGFPRLLRVSVRIQQFIGALRVFGLGLYKTPLQKRPSRGINELLSWQERNQADGFRPVEKVAEEYFAGKCRYFILIDPEGRDQMQNLN